MTEVIKNTLMDDSYEIIYTKIAKTINDVDVEIIDRKEITTLSELDGKQTSFQMQIDKIQEQIDEIENIKTKIKLVK